MLLQNTQQGTGQHPWQRAPNFKRVKMEKPYSIIRSSVRVWDVSQVLLVIWHSINLFGMYPSWNSQKGLCVCSTDNYFYKTGWGSLTTVTILMRARQTDLCVSSTSYTFSAHSRRWLGWRLSRATNSAQKLGRGARFSSLQAKEG